VTGSRERFDSEYIRSELERIGDRLEAPLTVYLIGGGSMAFRDLKETTFRVPTYTNEWICRQTRSTKPSGVSRARAS